MTTNFTPEYLDVDYNSLVLSIKDELAGSDIFKDYNYEGSNIATLIELVAYIGELNTFFLNKIARNVFMETADIYENVNRLARQEGYEPKGYVSSKTTLSLVVSADDGDGGLNFVENDVLYIPSWHKITSSKEYNGSAINFATVSSQTAVATSGSTVSFDVPVVQGEVVELDFMGSDIVDNELILPLYKYAHDEDIDDEYYSMELLVNDEPWTRISDFYDEISPLAEEDDVYMLVYDMYKVTKIIFSSSRNVPISTDEIKIYALKSLGVNGNVAANSITSPYVNFVKNTSNLTVGPNEDGWLDNSTMSITNAAASTGGADPEDVDEIKENSPRIRNTQYRNVTASDYQAYLESRSDVECAYAWGEQEVAPSGNVLDYNKVYISVVPPDDPEDWESGTINTSASIWTVSPSVSASIVVPTSYVSSWTTQLEEYLEPRKMLCEYEEFELPELVYFTFTFGVRLKRLRNFDEVSLDILNKLIYYFRPANRDFYDLIDFKDISEYILDTSITSPTDEFTYISGIRNFIIRDIDCNKTIYEANTDGNYPQYTTSTYDSDVENQLRPIRLGYNQYPVLASSAVSIVEES
jgi:hypothetical protein